MDTKIQDLLGCLGLAMGVELEIAGARKKLAWDFRGILANQGVIATADPLEQHTFAHLALAAILLKQHERSPVS